MKAEIISVGTELLLGEITDTNASYLASQLPGLGIDLFWVSQVGDNLERLVEVLRRAWGRSDLVLVTGGLGPTEDDITREAIAQLLGEKMTVDPVLERELREFFAKRSYPMPERNLKQATLIPSARAIPNPRGTAPGWWVGKGDKILISMPGPPSELRRMWEKEVSHQLQRLAGQSIIFSRTIKTFGIGEGSVDEMVSPWLSSANPTIGIYAKPDGIHLRLTAKARSREQALSLISPLESQIRSVLGAGIWGTDDDTLEKVVGETLLRNSLTLATMEWGTGGSLGTILSEPEKSRTFYKGGLIVGTAEAALACGLAPEVAARPAGSPELSQGMAEAARRHFQADIGVGIYGEASGAPTPEQPMDTIYLALDDGKVKLATQTLSPPRPEDRKRRAAVAALFMLRRHLADRGLLRGKAP